MVWKLDRFGRSLKELIELVGGLKERGWSSCPFARASTRRPQKLSHKCGSEDIVALSYALSAGEAQQSMDLTDEQWEVLEPLIPVPPRRGDGRGRPWRDPRDVLNGILWILRTGAPWKDLPERYPPYQTCHRRFQRNGSRKGSSQRSSKLWPKTSRSAER